MIDALKRMPLPSAEALSQGGGEKVIRGEQGCKAKKDKALLDFPFLAFSIC